MIHPIVVARVGIMYEIQNANSSARFVGTFVRASVQESATAIGNPMAKTLTQISNVLPRDRNRRGSLSAACQLSRPQVRAFPKNSGDVLKLLMSRKTTG